MGYSTSHFAKVVPCTVDQLNQALDSAAVNEVCGQIAQALLRVKQGEMSRTEFENYKKADSIGTNDPMRKARNFHNMGNIWYAQGMAASRQQGGNAVAAFQNAINYYKSSLRCNPEDDETRYNLAMAQHQLKKNQDQQQNGGGNDDKNKDKQDQDKQQQQKQDQQKQDQQKKDEEKQQQQQQPQPAKKKDDMSDQVAEQLLNSAQQDEKGVQQKVNKNQNNKRRSLEKDW